MGLVDAMGAVFNRVTLDATGQTRLCEAGGNVGDSGWQLTFAGSAWTGSIVLKQNTAPPGSAVSLSTMAYYEATTGEVVEAGLPIRGNGSVIVTDTGLDLYLDYTHTAGSVQVTAMAGSGDFEIPTVALANIDLSEIPITFPEDLAFQLALAQSNAEDVSTSS
jgi:hypothetical protein